MGARAALLSGPFQRVLFGARSLCSSLGQLTAGCDPGLPGQIPVLSPSPDTALPFFSKHDQDPNDF